MTAKVTRVEAITDAPLVRVHNLSAKARTRLEQNAHFHGRSRVIRIDEKDGTLILNGHVPSFYLKQILQAELGKIEGVKKIDNRVDVFWPETGASGKN